MPRMLDRDPSGRFSDVAYPALTACGLKVLANRLTAGVSRNLIGLAYLVAADSTCEFTHLKERRNK
jgi:hypothetical protein